jgi:hypothetical protein
MVLLKLIAISQRSSERDFVDPVNALVLAVERRQNVIGAGGGRGYWVIPSLRQISAALSPPSPWRRA